VNPSLDHLENSIDQAVARLAALAAENARLRGELADANERMAMASAKLRALAEQLPESAL
jgi:chromosome segregation ATPase